LHGRQLVALQRLKNERDASFHHHSADTSEATLRAAASARDDGISVLEFPCGDRSQSTLLYEVDYKTGVPVTLPGLQNRDSMSSWKRKPMWMATVGAFVLSILVTETI